MTGDSDYLLRIVVPDLEAYERFVMDFTKIAGIAQIRSSFALRTVKQGAALPLAWRHRRMRQPGGDQDMPTPIAFDPAIGRQFIKYARLVAARGYVHNTLGNIVMRAPHPDFPHGLAYTKHAEISLEEMELEQHRHHRRARPASILCGERMTSVGHNLSREILRLRPDINATIHVHDDAVIALLRLGRAAEFKVLSLDPPFVLGKPVHFVPAHVDVEADVQLGRRTSSQDTNSVVLVGHGITTLGRNVSEAYHRLNTLTAEVRRVHAGRAACRAARAPSPPTAAQHEIEEMYRFAERIIYPTRADTSCRTAG